MVYKEISNTLKQLKLSFGYQRSEVKKPDMQIDSTIHSRGYENQRHLEFGPDLPKTEPLRRPQVFIAAIATAVNEVIFGVRSVDQLQNVLNEHVYESLKRRAVSRAQYRMKHGRKPQVQPTDVVRVRYQYPAEGVIESVVVLSSGRRSKAVAIRLEGIHNVWRATNIGFI
jgi:Family of unknown function (DUF6459)